MSPAKKRFKLFTMLLMGAVYLGALIGGNWIMVLVAMNLTGFPQFVMSLVAVVCMHMTYRDLVTRYRVFIVSSAIETVLVAVINNAVDIERVRYRSEGKFVSKPVKYGAIDVAIEWREHLYKQWFWKAPNHFQFLNACFSWSGNPFAMMRQARPVSEVDARSDRFDLNAVEFQLSPTANNQDLLGMGWKVFRFITEHALNENIPMSDWRIRFDRTRGIELHHKERRNE